ncbi:MAG: hypothetical protein ACRC4M_02990 [Mycoplasma sp.]
MEMNQPTTPSPLAIELEKQFWALFKKTTINDFDKKLYKERLIKLKSKASEVIAAWPVNPSRPIHPKIKECSQKVIYKSKKNQMGG